MKKLLLSMALVLLGLNAAMAQSSLIATLSHEGNVSLFYGYNAFVDAMAAADHGDVITLSSGLFAQSHINKAVTIRGAAAYDDLEKGVLKTELNGTNNTYIDIPEETNGHTLNMEYIYLNGTFCNRSKLQSPKFQHMYVSTFNLCYSSGNYTTGTMSDAIFADFQGNITNTTYASFSIINSILTVDYRQASAQCNVFNSIVLTPSTYTVNYMDYINFKNCIFANCKGSLKSTNTCDHCVAIVEEGNSDFLANIVGGTNWTVNSSNEIFTGEAFYVLTPTAAQTYLGTDGTQVGVWGGPMPWQYTAENPTITKCQVAGRSTADGKLSVEIEVAGVQ